MRELLWVQMMRPRRTRTRINDRGVKASRTGRLFPERARRVHAERRHLGRQQPGREGQSRGRVCETRRHIFTSGVTHGRNERSALTASGGPLLLFSSFSSSSPGLLSVHGPAVHPSAGRFLRHTEPDRF